MIAKDLDNDERFTLGIINFLLDVGWVKQDSNGAYLITSKGKTSTIE
jgi:predicted transcriptional regulator